MRNDIIKPFVKWAGGKRQLLPEIKLRLPKRNNNQTYYEPFVGAGALLFDIQPKKAVINDFNTELINVYKVVQSNVDELIEDLKTHKNEKDYFYEFRELDRKEKYKDLSDIQKASRFIYLNKTCFNGLYRVNKSGYFNVPFASYKNPNIVNEDVLRAINEYFKIANIQILSGDFEDALIGVKKDDFVYFDPPYQPISESSSFTSYTANGFTESDQIRLKETCDKLDDLGVNFMVSNSNVPFIQKLYKDYRADIVQAKRAINSNGNKRGNVDELIITNY